MTITNADAGIARSADPAACASGWWGAAVGFSIAFVATLIGFGFDAPFLALGIPAATIAGWRLGPKVTSSGGVVGMAVAMGVATVAVADALVVVGSLGLSSASGGTDLLATIGGGVVVWSIGFVVVGIPMMILTIPCGVVWAVLVGALARQNARTVSDVERRAA